jgi:hypothetical protein
MSLKTRWTYLSLTSRIALGLMAILLMLEGIFDIFEIMIGQVMLWTNDKRPKVGRLWTEEERDLNGQQQASSRIDSLRLQPAHQRYIRSLDDLAAYLAFKSDLTLPRDEFISLYRSLPPEDAGKLIDPIILRDLAQRGNWSSIKLTHGEEKMLLLFLDAYGQPLLDASVMLLTPADLAIPSNLEKNALYTDRIIAAPVFVAAYNSLPQRIQLQIVNDPQKWREWSVKLISAAIAPRMNHGTVMVALEVAEAGSASLHQVEASELAVGYLINAINDFLPKGSYDMPAKEGGHE